MAIEKKWPAVPPQLFAVDGSSQGVIKVASAAGYKVKQKVVVSATGQPTLQIQVKRVIGPDTIIVGPFPTKVGQSLLTVRQDLSLYTTASGAMIFAEEQDKAVLKPEDIFQSVYRQEPGTTIGVEIDDQFGNAIDSIRDSNGINRLAVEGNFTAEVDVQVDVDVDGYYDAVTNPDPDNVGLIGHTRSNPTNQTHQVQRITAKRGTEVIDANTVSQDVSLHGPDGNRYTTKDPVPVSTTYEKFFSLIGASNWMKLANYDSVVPSFIGENLTLAYREDGALLGEAVITDYTSLTGWNLKLNRYINDDDGTQLLDDDGTPLNLD